MSIDGWLIIKLTERGFFGTCWWSFLSYSIIYCELKGSIPELAYVDALNADTQLIRSTAHDAMEVELDVQFQHPPPGTSAFTDAATIAKKRNVECSRAGLKRAIISTTCSSKVYVRQSANWSLNLFCSSLCLVEYKRRKHRHDSCAACSSYITFRTSY
jgi:hypothetical protein